jgi:hypothetical protein
MTLTTIRCGQNRPLNPGPQSTKAPQLADNISTRSLREDNTAQIEAATEYLLDVVQQGIEASIMGQTESPSPYANPDYTPEYREAVKQYKRHGVFSESSATPVR